MRLPEKWKMENLEIRYCDTCEDEMEHLISYSDHQAIDEKIVIFYEVECQDCGTNGEETLVIDKPPTTIGMMPPLQN